MLRSKLFAEAAGQPKLGTTAIRGLLGAGVLSIGTHYREQCLALTTNHYFASRVLCRNFVGQQGRDCSHDYWSRSHPSQELRLLCSKLFLSQDAGISQFSELLDLSGNIFCGRMAVGSQGFWLDSPTSPC